MSRIDDLIQKYAPDGVEYGTLGVVAPVSRGTRVVRKQLSDELQYPVYQNSLKPLGRLDRYNRDAGTTFVIGAGAAGDIGFSRTDFWAADDCYFFESDGSLDQRFLYHVLQSQRPSIASSVRRASIPRLSRSVLEKLVIPMPPLEVQREIVRILDAFAGLEVELEAELDAELETRKQQYAHYRDALLDFGPDDCEWQTLREIAIDFGRGKSKHRPRNDPRLYGGDYPFIQTGDVRGSGHMIIKYSQTYNQVGLTQSKLWPRGTICITIAANIAETGILGFDACFPDSVIGVVVDEAKASNHYVEYLLQSFKESLTAKGRGSAQANISLATFEDARFPFPSLDEQQRIVTVLDKFDALVTDLSSSLPAEIEARRAQYAYYRDRLLSFEEAAAR